MAACLMLLETLSLAPAKSRRLLATCRTQCSPWRRPLVAVLFLFMYSISAALAEPITLYSYNLPPRTQEMGGRIIGPLAHIVERLVEAAGLPPEATPAPVARLLSLVAAGNALGYPLARDPTREPRFQWIVELYQDSFAFVTLAPAAAVNTLNEARLLSSVGVNQASAPKNLLTAAQFTNLDIANSEAQNAAKLFAGNISAWFSVTSAFAPIAQAHNFDTSRLVIGAPVHPISAWLIGSKDLPEAVVQKIRAKFAAMKASGEYDSIMAGTLR